MSDWYNYDEKSKKALLTLMERAKRPMTVTAGKLMEFDLQTFTTVIRRSYSLLAVLKNY
nr:odorant receptor 16 [Monochamus saltuarius]